MPDSDNPPVGIPIQVIGEEGDEEMATTIETVLDQAFADNHEKTMHAGRRLSEGNDNISEQTKLMFLEEKMKIGPREAAASQRLDSSKLASEILQQRSAKGQPNKDGS